MRKIRQLFLLFGLALFLGASYAVQAQPSRSSSQNSQKEGSKKELPDYPDDAVTSGSVSVNGKTISYKATAGVIPIKDRRDENKVTAQMFYVAYVKDGAKAEDRPITFLYNGGPGSSSLWLHMGSFGPKRVPINGTEYAGGAPYKLVNNNYSLLDASDLVFIDMPGTGFGRIEKGKEKDYYGIDQDANAFANFIQSYITKNNRWNSPKFLFGESYGTLRSAVVSNILQSQHNINLNGVILLSQILNYGNSVDGPGSDPGNNKPYELALPTYAATAWYHKKLPAQHEDLDSFLKEVQHFALNEYAQALDQGGVIDDATFNKIAEQLHQYIGLPVSYIKKANLKIDGGEFRQQLLADEDESTGRLDTRFNGPTSDPLAQRSFSDPQSDAISAPYVALLNKYMRNTLKYGKDMTYRTNVYGRTNWQMKHGRSSGPVNVMGDLARAIKSNPKLQVMLATGYYDLATPYFEGIYELHQLPMPRKYQKNIHFALYESGHMVYVHEPSLKQMHEDVKNFIENNI